MNKWTNRFMKRAMNIAQWSKHPKHKVGAIIVDTNNHVISEGYNGPPRMVNDENLSKDTMRLRTLHAEMNAILHAQGRDLRGATMYVWPYSPCAICAAMAIQVGIEEVQYCVSDFSPTWDRSQQEALIMFREANVMVWRYEK